MSTDSKTDTTHHNDWADKPQAYVDAEIAEKLALTDKAVAEASAARATTNKTLAEARVAKAAAKTAEFALVAAGYVADKATETRIKELASDAHHHVYHFKGAVDSSTVDKCWDQLSVWDRSEDPSEIELIFYSPGGSVMAGMALFDRILELREKGWVFTTNVRGYAASMAGILLQAGDVRVCGPESYILIHEISSGAIGKIGELEDEVEFMKMVQERVWDIFVERSGGKVSKARLKAMVRRKDFWIDSTKALKLGIVDAIR